MDDRTWEDLQRDDEKRGWNDQAPPELIAVEVFLGYTDDGEEVWVYMI